ncbi:MAG: hypothetical protein GF329_16890 [Candidatus Lokiarchaeota archaeon]|nr:hypothetical protein [Candidatus Lokiarchaeota archaeon]
MSKIEVVIGSSDGYVYVINGENWSQLWNYSTGNEIRSSPSLADLNNDSKLYVVIICRDIYALNGENGTIIWNYTGLDGHSSPKIGDVDDDNKPEVIFGSCRKW